MDLLLKIKNQAEKDIVDIPQKINVGVGNTIVTNFIDFIRSIDIKVEQIIQSRKQSLILLPPTAAASIASFSILPL